MKTTTLLSKLSKIKNGTYFTIEYESDSIKLTAKARDEGYTVSKLTRSVVRTGVQYSNIQHVKDAEAQRTGEKQQRPDVYEAIIPNKLYRHKENGTDYLRVANTYKPTKSGSTQYFVHYPNGEDKVLNSKQLQELGIIQNSYWNKKDVPSVMTIKVSNILKLENKRV